MSLRNYLPAVFLIITTLLLVVAPINASNAGVVGSGEAISYSMKSKQHQNKSVKPKKKKSIWNTFKKWKKDLDKRFQKNKDLSIGMLILAILFAVVGILAGFFTESRVAGGLIVVISFILINITASLAMVFGITAKKLKEEKKGLS